MKKIDRIALTVTAVLLFGVTAANLFSPNRPTESATENRRLRTMPAFSWTALWDGSYFQDIGLFLSDTFPGRDRLVSLAKSGENWTGIPYTVNGQDMFTLLADRNDHAAQETDIPSQADRTALDNAFEKLEESRRAAEEESRRLESETESKPAALETGTETESGGETETQETNTVQSIQLSRSSLLLTVGSGASIHATVVTTDNQSASVSWSVSDNSIAVISKNPGGGVDVRGLAEGECTLLCQHGDITASCTINVVSASVGVNPAGEKADFLPGGMFIYGDAVYTQAGYLRDNAEYYVKTAAYYKSLFGEDVRVSIVVGPVSSMVIDNEEVKSKIADQGEILQNMAALADDSVNFVDTYTPLYEHRGEYLFFRSDHHWTARGAYYAYTAFAASVGLTPTPLDELEYRVLNDDYHGTMYAYTQDSRVQNFSDTVEAFVTKKSLKMTVTDDNGRTYMLDSCLSPYNNTYVSFICGDNPYTVINVPENPQDRNILVLKDSFGNAFVPYLCEHYGNIIVVDTRHTNMNVFEQLGDYGLTDIVFVNNIQAANNPAWPRMYLNAVGVSQ